MLFTAEPRVQFPGSLARLRLYIRPTIEIEPMHLAYITAVCCQIKKSITDVNIALSTTLPVNWYLSWRSEYTRMWTNTCFALCLYFEKSEF